MSLRELKKLIDYSIEDCQQIIRINPQAILSEGDFERILSNCISNRIGYSPKTPNSKAFAVYSQISHYNNESKELNARVDILLAKPADIKENLSLNKKFIIYNSAESFAIELKYRHDKNRRCVTAAKKDIDKYLKYKDDSRYYAIILLDKNENTTKHINEILSYYKGKKAELGSKYRNKFFCKVLVKEKLICRNR